MGKESKKTIIMLVDIIAGARPNFMKIAPIIEAINNSKKEGNNITYRLIHTGQHYDKKMSGSFFEELNIPLPDGINKLITNYFFITPNVVHDNLKKEGHVSAVHYLTLRDNTKRPETFKEGRDKLVDTNHENIKPIIGKLFAGDWKKAVFQRRGAVILLLE